MSTTVEEPKQDEEKEEKRLSVYQRFENFIPSIIPELERTWVKAIPFDAQRFIGMTLNLVRRKPDILKCEPLSLLAALRTCAEYALYPDDLRGHAWIIPRYDRKWGRDLANFQIGYQGMLTLFRRAKRDGKPVAAQGKCVEAERVYKGDHFEFEKGLKPNLVYRPNLDLKMNERELRLVYAIAFYADGTAEFDRMTSEELETFAETYVQAVQKGRSTPWTDSDFSREWMEKKTVLRQVLKLSPSLDDPTLSSAIALDERVDAGVSQQLSDGLDKSQRALVSKLLEAENVQVVVTGDGEEVVVESRPTSKLDKLADREAKPVNLKPEHNAPAENAAEKPAEKPVEAKKPAPAPEPAKEPEKKPEGQAKPEPAPEPEPEKPEPEPEPAKSEAEPPPPEDGDPGPAPEVESKPAPEPEKPEGQAGSDDDWDAMING